MKKILQACAFTMITLSCVAISSCTPDDEPKSDNTSNTSSAPSEVKPEIAKISSTATTSDFTVTFRVKSVNTPTVSMKYSGESGKTSSPSLKKSSTPTCVNIVEMKSEKYSWYYYKTTHTGFSGGTYVYYQISASNSKGSDKSSIEYCIIKR